MKLIKLLRRTSSYQLVNVDKLGVKFGLNTEPVSAMVTTSSECL